MGILNSDLKREAELFQEVSIGNYDRIVELLKYKASSIVNTQRYIKSHEINKLLNINSEYTNPYKHTPLMIASLNGFYDIVKCLIEYKANVDIVNQHGENALMNALKGKHYEIYDFLLKNNAILTISDNLNRNLFHYLSIYGDCKFCKLTILKLNQNELKMLLNQKNFLGDTPLNLSISLNKKTLSELYMQAGAILSFTAKDKKTLKFISDSSMIKEFL